MASRDPASDQLIQYKEKAKLTRKFAQATTSGGAPIINKDRSLTVGPRGPIPLSDVQFVEEVAHFVRERIPERVLHARGAGAFGFFEATADISNLTVAKVFHMGKRTPVGVRFSTTVGESGSPEAARDPKGMSVKFQTEDGILDLSGNHIPVYFLRDPVLFPSLVHVTKRNPKTHLPDPNMFWDFMSLRPETMSTLLHLFSDTCIPDGWRRMNSYPANVYQLVNFNHVVHYCRFIFECKEIKHYLSAEQASQVDVNYYSKDLYNAIERNNHPSWYLNIQIMTERQAVELMTRKVNPFYPFDNTKIWPMNEFPPSRIGILTLTSNPTNYFAEVEQLAFSPANLVPGIECCPHDKVLQARMFVYPDAQRYRLGANYQQLGPNRPLNLVKNYQRDGPQTYYHQGDDPNYHPNTFLGPHDILLNKNNFRENVFMPFIPPVEDDIWQNRNYLNILTKADKKILSSNIAGSLGAVTDPEVKRRMLERFYNVDPELSRMIKDQI